MTVFSRRTRHKLHGGSITESEWTVMAIHLRTSGLPHVVLDAKKHDKTFYDVLFVRFPRLRRATEVLTHINASAAHYFDLYVRPDASMQSQILLDDLVMQRLISNYGRFDVEIDNDMIYIFKQNSPHSARDLKEMHEEILWLAEKIEYRTAAAVPALV